MEGPHVQSLVYSMVARGEVILAHYSAFPSVSTSFAALAAACLPNLLRPSSSSSNNNNNNLFSYKCDSAHTFHFLVHDCFAYLVVSSNLEGEEIASIFLQRIKEDFYKRYGDATIDSERFRERSLDKDFGPKLKEHMHYCLDNSQKMKKLESMKDQILEVKEIITENIEKVLDSKEIIHLRVESIDIHHAQAENFHRQGQQLKKKMRIRQFKLRFLVLLVAAIIIISIWLIICKGFEC